MRSSPKNKDRQKHSPGPQPDNNRTQAGDPDELQTYPDADTGRIAPAGPADAQGSGKPGKQADPKKKLEDLNDREDLSDRTFSDRNWL